MKEIIIIICLFFIGLGCNPPKLHSVGELYGGGIIVSVWDSCGTQHGLIASLKDLSNASQWTTITKGETFIGSQAQSYSNGKANTDAIVYQNNTGNCAAIQCKKYSAGGYNDWYLPSIWELNECYKSVEAINRNLGDTDGFRPAFYWSSSEKSMSKEGARMFGDFALAIFFGNYSQPVSGDYGALPAGGNVYSVIKYAPWRVRAVRRF